MDGVFFLWQLIHLVDSAVISFGIVLTDAVAIPWISIRANTARMIVPIRFI
jgi:hypothetical protein